METFRKKVIEYLTENGLFERDAISVIDLAVKDKSINIRWSDKASDFPDAMLHVVLFYIRPIALGWIDANAPKAWYRGMFVDNE